MHLNIAQIGDDVSLHPISYEILSRLSAMGSIDYIRNILHLLIVIFDSKSVRAAEFSMLTPNTT